MRVCPHCSGQHAEHLRFCPTTGIALVRDDLFPEGTLLEDKYRVGRRIGTGGMGAVFEGTHVLLEKRVAIKVLLPEFARNREMVERLMREARAASATGHRHIAGVTDMGYTAEGGLFMVMEYVSGPTLKQLIRTEAPFHPSRASMLIAQVLSALEVVHRMGVVHRDLKPANIVRVFDEEGREAVKILDFGISKVVSDPTLPDLTTLGRVMGTPRYMAPEQADGSHDIDHRADLYACGVMFFELLTGAPPYNAPNYAAMIALVLDGKATPPSQVVGGIPAELDRVALKALARYPEQRFVDAAAFRRALLPFSAERLAVTQPGYGSGPSTAPEPAPAPRALPSIGSDVISFCGVDEATLLEDASAPSAVRASALSSSPSSPAVASPPAVASSPAVASPPAVASSPAVASAPAPARSPARADPPTPAAGPPVEPWADGARDVSSLSGGTTAEEPLELAVPQPSRAARAPDPATAAGQTLFRPTAPGGRLTWVVTLAAIVLVAAFGWHFRERLLGLFSSEPVAEPYVLLLIETEPSDADVYVDGVLAVTKPVQLSRSQREFEVRVQARGYLTHVVQVRADRTRALRVVLTRKPGR